MKVGLDENFARAEVALVSANLDLDVMKMEYSSKKKKAKGEMEKVEKPAPLLRLCQGAYKRALKAVEAVKLTDTTEGGKSIKL